MLADTGDPACVVCDESRMTSFARIRELDILRCPSCGARRLHPLPSEEETHARYGVGYFQGGADGFADYLGTESLHRRAARRRLSLLRAHATGGRVLDVGCACGFFLDEARRAGFDVRGIELCPEMADVAGGRFGLPVERGDFLASRLPVGSLDVVTFYGVLAHFRDPAAALEKARALLRSGGVLAVETWDADSPMARLLGPRWPFLTPPSVLHFLGRRTLPRLLRRAGFEPVARRHGGKSVTLSTAMSTLRYRYPGRLVASFDSMLKRARWGERLALPSGFGQLLTVIARRP